MDMIKERARDKRVKIIDLEGTASKWLALRQNGVSVAQIAQDAGVSVSVVSYMTRWWAQRDDGIRDYTEFRRLYRTDYVSYDPQDRPVEHFCRRVPHKSSNQGAVLDRENDGRCKLTETQMIEILRLRINGLSYHAIGKAMEISPATAQSVCQARCRRTT